MPLRREPNAIPSRRSEDDQRKGRAAIRRTRTLNGTRPCGDGHLAQRDLAEEKSCSPKGASCVAEFTLQYRLAGVREAPDGSRCHTAATPEPRAMREHCVVPSIGSRDVA